jgi:propionyl-CoA carboxylase alpha chain
VHFAFREREIAVGHRENRAASLAFEVDGEPGAARVHEAAGDWIDLEIDGIRERFSVVRDDERVWVQSADGEVALTELPRFPQPELEQVSGGYLAPMPGKVLSVVVAPGDKVSAGQLLLTLEAMKMEHRITCGADGVVAEVRVGAGSQVEASEILLVITPADATGEGT